MLSPVFVLVAATSTVGPVLASFILSTYFRPSSQQYQLVKCFSLLVLGMFLSALATLNFSLALFIGLFSTPVTFIPAATKRLALRSASLVLLFVVAPTTLFCAACMYSGLGIARVLEQAAFGWNVWGMYTPGVVWCVWWPAWLAASIYAQGQPDATAPVSAVKKQQ